MKRAILVAVMLAAGCGEPKPDDPFDDCHPPVGGEVVPDGTSCGIPAMLRCSGQAVQMCLRANGDGPWIWQTVVSDCEVDRPGTQCRPPTDGCFCEGCCVPGAF